MDSGAGVVAGVFNGSDLSLKGCLVRDVEAELTQEHAEFGFGHIEPTSMLGGEVESQPFENAIGFSRRKGFVQGSRLMSVEVIHDQVDTLDIRVGHIN